MHFLLEKFGKFVKIEPGSANEVASPDSNKISIYSGDACELGELLVTLNSNLKLLK